MLSLFEEFEEMVNGQMFSFADEIEEKIESLSLKVLFNEKDEFAVEDLQVFPSAGDVTFKLAHRLNPPVEQT